MDPVSFETDQFWISSVFGSGRFWIRSVFGSGQLWIGSVLDQISFWIRSVQGQFRHKIGTGLGKVRVSFNLNDEYLQQLAYRYRLVDQGQLIDSVPILDHRVSV